MLIVTGHVRLDPSNVREFATEFRAMRRSLAMRGRWIFIGQLSGKFVRFNPAQLFLRGISILSAQSNNRRQLLDCLELVCRGLVRPVVSASMPLEQAAEAHRMVENAAPTGRILLRP